MPSPAPSDTIRVQVSDDRLRAELVIPHRATTQGLTPESLRPVVEHAQVVWDDQVAARIAEVLAAPRTPGKASCDVIARGRPPRHGKDGSLEWTIDDERQHQRERTDSHYDRSAFITVAPGDVLGRLIPPDIGEPGRDVTGKPIPAITGKPHPIRLDDSITHRDDGALVANTPGLLNHSDRVATIQPLLNVREGVDFSTGNIDFAGSVMIHRGIKDRFHVKATQDVHINGLVEAATIDCGGNLTINAGFAGREQGTANVANDMTVRYLDAVAVHVGGNLHVAREIINSDVVVYGNVLAPSGSVIGGSLTVAGRLHVANLGSAGSVRTHITVGCVPRLEPLYDQLHALRDDFARRIKLIEKQINDINGLSDGDRLNDDNQRRLIDLQLALDPLQSQLDRAELVRSALEQRINQLRAVNVQIDRRLHEGVVIQFKGLAHLVRNTVDGPVQLLLDPDGVLIYEGRHAGGPITEITELLVTRNQAA